MRKERVERASNAFVDELRKQGTREDIVANLVESLISWKWNHPFLVECAHHAVFIKNEREIGQVDTEGRDIASSPGVHDSFRLWVLAAKLRRTTGRNAFLVLSLSDLHLIKGSEERAHLLSLLKNEEIKWQLLAPFSGTIEDCDSTDLNFSVVTQSEGTKLVRNRMHRFVETKPGDAMARARKIFKETGRLVIHAKMDDGIEAIYLSTPTTRASGGRLSGGVPLLSKSDHGAEWETQCGPTVAWIHARMYDEIGQSRPETNILTFDDILDPSIGLKSQRWVHIVDEIIGVTQARGMRACFSSHNGEPVLYSRKILASWVPEDFQSVLDTEMQVLAKQGFTEIGIHHTELIRFEVSGAIAQGCEIWLCAVG